MVLPDWFPRIEYGFGTQQVLTAGVQLLDSLMQSYGFVYTATTVGVGSGGAFAAGEFRRGDRSLELHYRYSLGLVSIT